jgi:gentisate 1,2-dioxygenase
MNSPARVADTAAGTTALAAFSADISKLGLSPLWERKARLVPGSDCVPALWRYAALRPLLARSAELITKKQAERRVLVMENPALRGTSFITNSLYAGLQIILPGEVAPSHRHTPSALRFVVEGEGAYLAVAGERIAISPGDFVVTPPWAWHDHGNLGNGPVVWLDGLDTPFAQLFGAHFRENHPDDSHPAANVADSPLIFRFAATQARLREMAKTTGSTPDPVHGHRLRYAHPATGAHAFLTMSACMQRLPAGFRGQLYRCTESQVFNLATGRCRVEMGGRVHDLQPHDCFVIPPWEAYRLEADADSFLFSFSDRAAQEALGYWREQPL